MGPVSEDNGRPLGEWLRQRREELGITLAQAQADTRIRVTYLEALEAERYAELPDAVVGRGFLRNYASYLKLDVQEALARFSARVAPPPGVTAEAGSAVPNPFTSGPFQPVPLHEIRSAGSRRRWLLALGGILVISLAALAWWAVPRLDGWLPDLPWPEARGARSTPTQELAGADLQTATLTAPVTGTARPSPATATATVAPPTVTLTLPPRPSATPTQIVYAGISLRLVFSDTSWIQVTVDGVRQEQGELPAGTSRLYQARERVELRVGNAGAVLATLNGEEMGPLGAKGEVVDRIYELAGGQVNQATGVPGTPTAEATATALRPAPTRTPRATATLTVTPTATLTAVPTP